MNRVMTTGQVARVFNVNINTVIKWFDEGKLEGFRLPRSNERRIYRESVQAFMKLHGITDDLLRVYEENRVVKKRGRKPGSTLASRAAGDTAAPTGAELRVFPRKPVDLDGVLVAEGLEAEPTPVQVRNLSLGGAYLTGFAATRNLIPGEFQLIVRGTDGAPNLETTCEVVHLRRTDDHGITMGCRFTRVDPSRLQTWLAQI